MRHDGVVHDCRWTDQVFPSFHQPLIDDFTGEAFARLDMNGFFDNGISAAAQRLARTILMPGHQQIVVNECQERT